MVKNFSFPKLNKIKKVSPQLKKYLLCSNSLFNRYGGLFYIKDHENNLVYCNITYIHFYKKILKIQSKPRFLTLNMKTFLASNEIDLEILKKKIREKEIKENYGLEVSSRFKGFFFLTTKMAIYEKKKLMGLISFSKDITEIIKEKNKATYQATHDNLTGFLDKKAFKDKFIEEVLRTNRNKKKLALLYIDLDKFKLINDNYGHIMGDQVLVIFCQRLKKLFRSTDYLCRFGGDEFIILITTLENKNNSNLLIDFIVQKVNEKISEKMIIKDKAISLSASVGYSIYPDDGKDLNTLINKSDLEMYKKKREKLYSKI